MKYRALWIDDDCKTTGRDFIGQAEQDDIDITAFESHEEGMAYLEKNLNYFHVVILDAKVKHKKDDTVIGLEGLRASRDRLIELNNRIELPYFIFTGQPDYQTNEMFRESYGDFYIKGADEEKLIHDIIERVEHLEEYILHKEYQKVFEIFADKYIGNKGASHLLNILKKENKNKAFDNPDLYFNPLRKIMDDLFIAFNKYGILPSVFVKPSVSFNESSKFLSGFIEKDFQLDAPVFPKVVSDHVRNILAVCQPAAHRAEIDMFVSQVNSPYLLLSVTYQLLDILLWFKGYIDINGDIEVNKLRYHQVERAATLERIVAIIEKDKLGNHHCGNYVLTYTHVRDNDYKVGDEIRILRTADNTNIKTMDLYSKSVLDSEKN
ncbi:MAG: hypothetical protein IPN14_08405 [Bacteroidetes bacterium]|nr:hypothetical protein [Bacteroidota bacterium]